MLRAGFEPAATSTSSRTGPFRPAAVTATRGRDSNPRCRAREGLLRPTAPLPRNVLCSLSAPLAHPSALDRRLRRPTWRGARAGRSPVHCRKIGRAQHAAVSALSEIRGTAVRAFLSQAGPRGVAAGGSTLGITFRVVGRGQQKGRPIGPPSQTFGGYAP